MGISMAWHRIAGMLRDLDVSLNSIIFLSQKPLIKINVLVFNLSWDFACPQPILSYRISKMKNKQYEYKHRRKHIKTSKGHCAVLNWQAYLSSRFKLGKNSTYICVMCKDSDTPRNSCSSFLWSRSWSQKKKCISAQYCKRFWPTDKRFQLWLDERKLASPVSLNYRQL